MLLGSDGPGGIEFDDAELARQVGVVGLVLILFEGGLQTSWRRLRGVAVPAALLSTVGVVVTALLTGVAARLLFDLTWLEAILLGAVVASTDAAAVFATLRFTHIRRRLARTLEAESGGNDPMAIALTLGLIAWIESPDTHGFDQLALLVVRQIGLGLIVGVALAAAATWVFARLPRSVGPFAPVASLSAAGLSFGAADVIGGSGFLAVYLVGLAVGSTPSRYRRQLVGFHEGIAYLAQVTLFIVFGLLVFPHQLTAVAGSGLALALLLMLLVRPAAVWVSTAFNDFTARERLLLGWAGLRGAVPIVLATFVLSSQVDSANTIFNAVFFVVVISAILQGTTLEWVAGRLGLLSPVTPTHEPPIELGESSTLDLLDFVVAPDHAIAGAAVREVGLPRTAIIAVVVRGDDSIPPRGSTTIEPGDRLFVLAPRSARPAVEDVFSRWRRRV
jgi:cell volume regulation protein A